MLPPSLTELVLPVSLSPIVAQCQNEPFAAYLSGVSSNAPTDLDFPLLLHNIFDSKFSDFSDLI